MRLPSKLIPLGKLKRVLLILPILFISVLYSQNIVGRWILQQMYKDGKLILSSPILKHEYTKDNNWYEYVWFDNTFNLSEIGEFEAKEGELKVNLIDDEIVNGNYTISGDSLLTIEYRGDIIQILKRQLKQPGI